MNLEESSTKGKAYFFDTYAVIEILKNNPSYKKYVNCYAVLTQLNMFELYYILLRDQNSSSAKKAMDAYYPCVFPFNRDLIEDAAMFRLKFKKRNLSMTDCVGYVFALKKGIRFLTGDKEFEDLPNVEFVQ